MNKKILITLSTLIFVVFCYFLYPSEYTKELKTLKLSNKNFIFNETGYKEYSIIIDKGLELAGLENKIVTVKLMPMVINMVGNKGTTLGKIHEVNGEYIMTLVRQPRFKQIDIIAHEIIHIIQYEENRLKRIKMGISWEGEVFKIPYSLEYNSRPWEIDAVSRGDELAKKMKNALLIKRKKDLF